jgi:ubiquinone/menaquinone biosynthesis C-methylase UbiE
MTDVNKWTDEDHATGYLAVANEIPHRSEGEGVLLDCIPQTASRILDLGCGDGRLLALALERFPEASGVAVDFSPAMLARARRRFRSDPRVSVREHNLDHPLPDFGKFDAVISCFAIHHLTHQHKRARYKEVLRALKAGGVFCNLEHVSSSTPRLHAQFLAALGQNVESEDPSNKLLDVETQLGWLRASGFQDVDCHWKWLELALLAGVRPA